MTVAPPPQLRPLGYLPALDGLRCVAVMLVVLSHVFGVFAGGRVGVDVFFAISGFLITTLLLEERVKTGRVRFGRFYLRRAIRLAPALITLVVIVSVLTLGTGVAQPKFIGSALGALFYLTPVTRKYVQGDPIFDHTWSLGLEEYFYLLWPLILVGFILWRSRLRLLSWATVVGAVALYGLYAYTVLHHNETGTLRIAGIALGCGYALHARRAPRTRHPAAWTAAGIVAIGISAALGNIEAAWAAAYALAALGALAVIHGVIASDSTPVGRALAWGPVVFLGVVSYEIYLWHVPVLELGGRWLSIPYSQWAWAGGLVAIGLAIASNRLLLPLQRWMRAAMAKQRPVDATAAATEAASF